jgi:uncharacterized protein YllA (UPF0747 family)
LSPDDVARPVDELLGRVTVTRAADAADPTALMAAAAEDITPRVAALTAAVETAFPHLTRAADRTRRSVAHALTTLTRRYARELLARDTTTHARLRRLQDRLMPGGVPQERVYGWPSLAATVGPQTLKRLVFEEIAKHGTFVTHLLELSP